MFENIIHNVKSHSAKLSETLNIENLRSQTTRLSENVENIKNHTSRLSDNLMLTLKKSKFSNFFPVSEDTCHISQQPVTDKSPQNRVLKWPVLVDNKMQWITLQPNGLEEVEEEEEEEDIVARFIRVITPEDDSSPKRRNDREEIRRRLAMGSDTDDYYSGDRPGRKPSLQARLQSGMNLQICFMNETASDVDSPSSDTETSTCDSEKMSLSRSHTLPAKQCTSATGNSMGAARPSASLLTLPLQQKEPESSQPLPPQQPLTEADFFARQARLQAEARLALAQAKEMAHMQMEVERQRQKKSPITEMVRSSLEKVGIPFPEDRRRVSRQLLTEMNVAQLQVIVNDLHTQIEVLNEGLVKFLMDRDDLHMEQDSMLVDIEDLTRYLGAKEQSVKEQQEVQLLNQNNNLLSPKPKLNRIAGLVKK